MALPKLADSADLSARGVDISDGVLVETMLSVASALVREAAGSPILSATVTVSWWVTEWNEFETVPVRPLRSVASVTLDGEAVTDHKVVYNDLWRSAGWFNEGGDPVEIEATLTAGLPAVPESIKQLVCDLAILGMNSATSGAVDPRVVAERIDDYSVTFAQGAEAVASAMTIPSATRASLRARFGGGVGSVRLR
jgi:hypothetical protein